MGNVVGTYDARNVTTTVNGVFLTGYADSSFVKCTKDNDNFEATASAQGDVGVSINGDNLGTIEITLNQTSPSIPYLTQLANSRTMFPIWVTSNNQVKEVHGGTKAMIKKVADAEYGKSISPRVYTIQVFDYQSK